MIIPTEHGWIVDAERTRHCVTSRYTGAKPNDANRTCQTNRHKVIIKKKYTNDEGFKLEKWTVEQTGW